MRAVAYLRVSTDEQASDGFSLGAQEERCKSFIQSQGWELAKAPYIDDGYSAKDLERPAIQQLIRDLKNNEFDVVVVYRLDRLVRSVIDLHHLLQLFDEHKIHFKSVTEVFDTTSAMGRLFITIVAAMAQWERENLAERVLMGMERRALEGKRNGGEVPFGYRVGDDGRLVVHPEEAKVVKMIFDLYMKHGTATICKILNEKGIKTKHGGPWTQYTLRYLLSNPVYTGKLRWKHSTVASGKKRKQETHKVMYIDSDHEPIISVELFEEAQRRKDQRREGPAKALTSDYPFSGVLVCGRCGRPMVGNKKTRRSISYFYLCSGRDICSMPVCNERAIEEALFKLIELDIDPAFTPPEMKENETEELREQIEKEIEVIKKRRRKWLIQFGDTDDEEMMKEINDLISADRKREEELMKQLEELPSAQPQAQLSKEEFIELFSDLRYVWSQADRRERKELIHQLFKKIVIEPDMDFKPGSGRPRPVKIVEYELNS